MKRFFVIFLMAISFSTFAEGAKIGVYYFPGWKDNQPYAPSSRPWDPIKLYPERKPLLGWYPEGADFVMQQQISWMKSYGLNYVVFDWYYGKDRKVYLEHALAAYMRSPNRAGLDFSILWANHDAMPQSFDDWKLMVTYWVKYYFIQTGYLRIDNKPVVFIFSAQNLKDKAEAFGMTTSQLLTAADNIANAAGFKGIYFIGGTGAQKPMINYYAKDHGYSALSAYNYHGSPGASILSHSYVELDKSYQEQWNVFLQDSSLPYIVPMTNGWDRRPWGGSSDPLHDNSFSTPAEFKQHLTSAKKFIDANPTLTNGYGVICCWNEFGEGSYIEPTSTGKFNYLEQVKSVFGK